MKKLLIAFTVASTFSSCVVVKEYEKVMINDPDMELSDKNVERNISTFHSYREAAVGGNGGKTGGGCGCN
jgi:hypothetical protein